MQLVLLARQNIEFGLRLRAGEAGSEATRQQQPEKILSAENIAARLEIGHRGIRQPKLERFGPTGSAVRNHANDDYRAIVNLHGAANQMRVRSEAVVPQ